MAKKHDSVGISYSRSRSRILSELCRAYGEIKIGARGNPLTRTGLHLYHVGVLYMYIATLNYSSSCPL